VQNNIYKLRPCASHDASIRTDNNNDDDLQVVRFLYNFMILMSSELGM